MENHYRNLYQIVKRDKDELERELEEYKTLSTMQQDIINSQNERINNLEHSIQVLENNSNFEKIKIDPIRIVEIR